jgi:hypothetical protein
MSALSTRLAALEARQAPAKPTLAERIRLRRAAMGPTSPPTIASTQALLARTRPGSVAHRVATRRLQYMSGGYA